MSHKAENTGGMYSDNHSYQTDPLTPENTHLETLHPSNNAKPMTKTKSTESVADNGVGFFDNIALTLGLSASTVKLILMVLGVFGFFYLMAFI
jgi:hypothetical protein